MADKAYFSLVQPVLPRPQKKTPSPESRMPSPIGEPQPKVMIESIISTSCWERLSLLAKRPVPVAPSLMSGILEIQMREDD